MIEQANGLYRQALSYKHAKLYKRSIQEFQRAFQRSKELLHAAAVAQDEAAARTAQMLIVYVLHDMAATYVQQGSLEAADATLHNAVKVAASAYTGDARYFCDCYALVLSTQGDFACYHKRWQEAFDYFGQARGVLEQHDMLIEEIRTGSVFPVRGSSLYQKQAYALSKMDRLEEALHYAQAAVDFGRFEPKETERDLECAGRSYSMLARLQRDAGLNEEALETSTEGLALVKENPEGHSRSVEYWRMELRFECAHANAALGNTQAARQGFRHILELMDSDAFNPPGSDDAGFQAARRRYRTAAAEALRALDACQ